MAIPSRAPEPQEHLQLNLVEIAEAIESTVRALVLSEVEHHASDEDTEAWLEFEENAQDQPDTVLNTLAAMTDIAAQAIIELQKIKGIDAESVWDFLMDCIGNVQSEQQEDTDGAEV